MSAPDASDIVLPSGGEIRRRLRVSPGGTAPVDLAAIDPRATPGLPDPTVTGPDRKSWTRDQVKLVGAELARQQEMLFATAKVDPTDRRRLLLVLQAMDCGGKDGTVKRVAGAMNPLGLRITSFGPPTEEELGHDFLWRIRRALPAAGRVGIFNRSHYEDVLIGRVEALVPEAVLRARYDEINAFEEEIAADGVTLVKVMLHISREEQRDRLLERLTDPRKHWKYDPADVDARARWDDYQAAYAEALGRCATEAAPWYVVPADRKWYRDWAVAHLLRETFATLDLRYPSATVDLAGERQRLLVGDPAKVNNG